MSKRTDGAEEGVREPSTTLGGLPRGFFPAVAVLVLVFAWPLFLLVRFSIGHELYSHIVLIPLISAYLVWQMKAKLPAPGESRPNRKLAAGFLILGAVLLAAYGSTVVAGAHLEREDSLCLTTLSFLCLFAGFCAWFLGRVFLRAILFPLTFLLFMVPMPLFMSGAIETFLQHGSAAVAEFMFKATGTTVFARGLVFQLPGITIEVAPECSGIHSTLALFITSVLAGYFFLRSPVRRTVLALAVLPLALVRNGFRVFVIGQLCVHISPDMINSYIHRHGGPIFFVLSLIPFFALLYWLVRQERRVQGGEVVRGKG